MNQDLTKIAWEVVNDCVAKVKHHTGKTVKIHAINMSSRAYRVWAKADIFINPDDGSHSYEITISKKIFVKDSGVFRKTIAHEFAHLADYQVYGGWSHGRSWQKIMREFLCLSANRLVTQEEIAEIENTGIIIPERRKTSKHMYLCNCGQKWPISGRIHAKYSRNHIEGFVCSKCESKFVYSGITQKV